MDSRNVSNKNKTNTQTLHKDQINERLKAERQKALDMLEKSSRLDSVVARSSSNKEINSVRGANLTSAITQLIPIQTKNTINISDLVTDKTIYMESSSTNLQSAQTDDKISFEPGEITGRSTTHPQGNQRSSFNVNMMMSVEEILATSCSEEVRRLRDSLCSNSSITNFSDLPRTADMSRISRISDMFGSQSEDFIPAEKMQSKFLLDEQSWAQEYAPIPTAGIGKEEDGKIEDSIFRSSKINNSFLKSNPNFSLGKYFVTRSEDLGNICASGNPRKERTPKALVDNVETMLSLNSELDSRINSFSLTPHAIGKTYSFIDSCDVIAEKDHISKDSGNSSDCSYALSMSAIQKALNQIQSEDSSGQVLEHLMNAKKAKSGKNQNSNSTADGSSMKSKKQDVIVLGSDDIAENKENVDPKSYNNCDTLSFTDSLLNNTSIKSLDRSNKSPRQPLSPIEVAKCPKQNSEDADLDELPSTPVKSPYRKVRYVKSPKEPHPAEKAVKEMKSLASAHADFATENADCEDNDLTTLSTGSSSNRQKKKTITQRNRAATSCLSSPHSSTSSHPASPIGSNNNDNSPNLDSTLKSDRCFLFGNSVSSSPIAVDHGKLSLPAYGIVQRTTSTVSLKSRTNSRCSNSSEFNQRDGKAVPLKVTCLELSWGSTRLRTNSCKTMQIKNTSTKRLTVRMTITGPGFQIANAQGNVTLQSQECRSITISFYPTVVGAAVGVLSFSLPSLECQQSFLEVPIYGYGGHAGLVPQNILRGPVGAAFLPFGELREISPPIEKTIRIYNRGVLNGFAVFIIDSIGLDFPRVCDSIKVTPTHSHIPPHGIVNFRITFTPRRDDLKKIAKKINSVLTLANLRIITGDEPNRQRILNLLEQIDGKEKSQNGLKALDQVWHGFDDFVPVDDLKIIKERPEVAVDLVSSMRIHEVAITINHDVHDETTDTSSLMFADADDTVLFRTIGASSSSPSLDTVEENHEKEEEHKDDPLTCWGRFWSVFPKTIEFNFENPNRRQDQAIASIVVQNFFVTRQYFEVGSNCTDFLYFKPSEGYLEGKGGQCKVEIFTQKNQPPPKKQAMIWVYLENQRITVFLNSASSK